MKNQKGLSLVELLIAVGGVATLALLLMNLFKQQMSNQVRSETKFEHLELKRLISTTLLDRKACTQTFASKKIGDQFTEIKNSSGSPLYKAGDVLAGTIKIVNFKTVHLKDNGDGTHQIDLLVDIDNSKKIAELNPPPVIIPLKVSAPGSDGLITDCFTEGSHYVRKAGDTMSGDLIVETKVGIGTAHPAVHLDVAGGVKISNHDSNCDSNLEGTQRYNSNLKAMEFCDGSSWKKIGSGNISLKCKSVNVRGKSSSLTATCPADHIVTGCTAGCNGGTDDMDIAVQMEINSCHVGDSNCAGSTPERNVSAICCRILTE
jgi:hypothetical protein